MGHGIYMRQLRLINRSDEDADRKRNNKLFFKVIVKCCKDVKRKKSFICLKYVTLKKC